MTDYDEIKATGKINNIYKRRKLQLIEYLLLQEYFNRKYIEYYESRIV